MFNPLLQQFKKTFNYDNNLIRLQSPGRVNLIGEHTDYNEGFVFPAAIDLTILAVASPREDSLINAYSMDFNGFKSFNLRHFEKENKSWDNYIKGVAKELSTIGELKFGADIVFSSTLPADSGLSSSAAFELINGLLLCHFNGIKLPKVELALLCQRAENHFIGVNCGIMDQFAIALGEKDTALFLDTRDLSHKNIKLSLKGYQIVVANTNKPRTLADSAYNERRGQCEAAVTALQKSNPHINSLRDVGMSELSENKDKMTNIIFSRARHVIEENDRVLRSIECLEKNDLQKFGQLMIKSHESLRDLYEVSCTELDVMVEEALKIDGVLGSRMTGAGFGGCTVSIVPSNQTDQFVQNVGKNYRERTGITPTFHITHSVKGVEIID